MKRQGISLKYKLILALTLIPFAGLSVFLVIATQIFEDDKISYVYDSSLAVSKTRAARVNSELSNLVNWAQTIVFSYERDTKSIAQPGKYYFQQENRLLGFYLYGLDASKRNYKNLVHMTKPSVSDVVPNMAEVIYRHVVSARGKNIQIRTLDLDRLIIATRFGDIRDPKHLIALQIVEASELRALFGNATPYRGVLMGADGRVHYQATFISQNLKSDIIWEHIKEHGEPEGIVEISLDETDRSLVSFVDVGIGGLKVASVVDRSQALEAVDHLIEKSLLFFIAVVSVTAILAVLISRGLTSALRRLSAATTQIAEGRFDVFLPVGGGAEVSKLAVSFNLMAEEISRLLKETAEKARMELELDTAKTVQETLFPKTSAKILNIDIAGHYVPASECGGDWWYYFENNGRIYIFIADATGHGASAALMTSAARAVGSVIQDAPLLSPAECMSIFNRAIYETSKGRMMMTFFIACFDPESGTMSYSNASHDPPFCVQEGSQITKKSFVPLTDANNPRLGENSHLTFKEVTVEVPPNSVFIFYTDGLVDVKNADGKIYGERRFLKKLAKELSSEKYELDGVVKAIDNEINEFRRNVALDDDVTLVLTRFRGAA